MYYVSPCVIQSQQEYMIRVMLILILTIDIVSGLPKFFFSIKADYMQLNFY